MVEPFLEYIAVERKYSPRTVQAYADALHELEGYLDSPLTRDKVQSLTEEQVRDWVVYLMEDKHNAPRSIKQKLSALHSFYKFLLRQQVVDKDITRRVLTPKVDKPLPVFFKPQEMQAATAYDDQADDKESVRDSLIIEMLFQTGMRQAEMLNLKDQDVDIVQKQIRIFGKRRKERIVPIGDSLCSLITRYREMREGDYGTFFVHWKKNGEVVSLTKDQLYNIVTTRMGEVSTLKKHSPHVLRHTFATTMLNNGADIRTIQALLGHASLAATQVYAHTTFEQIRNVYNAAHPRANKK